jgi:hypothetical protein
VQHVLLVGGPPRSGKTTVARSIARRHGLRLYSADTKTWEHRDRALRLGSAAARQWEGLTPDARWSAPTQQLLAMSLHADRGAMVMEDLAQLPTSPLVMAEGSTVPAWAVSSGGVQATHAVWLLPTTAFFEEHAAGLAEGPRRLYWRLLDQAAHDVEEHGVSTVMVDGSASISDIVEVVTAGFGEILARGPSASTAQHRRLLLHEMNAALIAQVRDYYARPWAEGDPDLVTCAFVCECGSPDCGVDIEATVGEAKGGPLLALGHSGPS